MLGQSTSLPDEAFAGSEVSERAPTQDDGDELPTLVLGLQTPSSSGCTSPDPEAGPSGVGQLTPNPEAGPSGIVQLTPVPAHAPAPASNTSPSPGPGPTPAPASVTPESIRPYPKGPTRPTCRGRKKIRACILTEDTEALSQLRTKEEKKVAKMEKKRLHDRKGKDRPGTKRKKVEVVHSDGSSDNDPDDPAQAVLPILDDSSDFSEDLTEDMEPEAYPFVDKEPEVRDFFKFSHVITA